MCSPATAAITRPALLSLKVLLKSPQTLVNTLEHKGPILSLDIHRHAMGMSVIHYPVSSSSTHDDESIERLPTLSLLPYNDSSSRTIPSFVTEHLQKIVHYHGVQGFLVHWPLQPDTGKMGAPCGRVLYTLESILAQQQQQQQDPFSSILSPQRPICLWDPNHNNNIDQEVLQEDEWGRCALHARTSNRTIFLASRERYTIQGGPPDAPYIWDTFFQAQWPDWYQRRQAMCSSTRAASASPASLSNLISDWRERPDYAAAAS